MKPDALEIDWLLQAGLLDALTCCIFVESALFTRSEGQGLIRPSSLGRPHVELRTSQRGKLEERCEVDCLKKAQVGRSKKGEANRLKRGEAERNELPEER
jgi:hypothetical protein